MGKGKIRHTARSLALQQLYAWDLTRDISEGDLVAWDAEGDGEPNVDDTETNLFSTYLVQGTKEHLDEIDELIRKYSRNRSVEKIGKINRNILRLSIFSLFYTKEIHPNIVIDEAVKLSIEFSDDISYSFINGVLDAIKKNEL